MIFLETENGDVLNMAHVIRIIIQGRAIVAELSHGTWHQIYEHHSKDTLEYGLTRIKGSLKAGYNYIKV